MKRRRCGECANRSPGFGLPLAGSTDILALRYAIARSLPARRISLEATLRAMRFNLVDRIVEVEPGKRIRVAKNLTLGEEYLADHFPTFPVMPGVLMLQALVEAGAWLLRISEDFRHSVVVLREAKNVKYGNFMEPGRTLMVSAELVETGSELATLKGKGEVEGNATVSARYTLTRYNLRDRAPALESVDRRLVEHWRCLHGLLTR